MNAQPTSLSRRLSDALILLFSIAALALCVHRAANASLTHDEAYTFLRYPALSVHDLLHHSASYTNNHLLNSLAMKCSIALFGTSELAVRLPNLLALVLFLFYLALMIRRCHPLLAIAAFPLVFANSYFLEMFTLARGYGLSYGFLAMAMYHAQRAILDTRSRHVILLHAAGILATLSNFALLTGYLAVLGAYALGTLAWARRSGMGWRFFRQDALVNVAMLLVAYKVLHEPIQRMREGNKLDFGGKATFYWDTVSTLIDSLVPGISLQGERMQTAWVVLTLPLAIALILVIVRLSRRDAIPFLRSHAALVIATLTLVLIGIGAYLQHLLFGVDHLKGRFALFLLVPLMLTLILLLQLWAARRPVLPALLAAAWSALAVPRFVQGFGPTSSWEWNYDTQTKSAMRLLADDHRTHWGSDGFVQVGITWLFEPSMNYYRQHMGLDWLCELDREGLRDDDDYRYVLTEDTLSLEGYSVVARFERSNSLLLRNESRLRALTASLDSASATDSTAHAHP